MYECAFQTSRELIITSGMGNRHIVNYYVGVRNCTQVLSKSGNHTNSWTISLVPETLITMLYLETQMKKKKVQILSSSFNVIRRLCLRIVTVVMKRHAEKLLAEEKGYLTYRSQITQFSDGSEDRYSNQAKGRRKSWCRGHGGCCLLPAVLPSSFS